MRIITTMLLIFVMSVSFAQLQSTDIYGSRSSSSTLPAVQSNEPEIIQQASGLLVLDEGFDDILTLPGDGWVTVNNSVPIGSTNWFQGNNAVFSAYDGDVTAYIGANFNNAAGTGDISNWLISPQLTVSNGDYVRFFTRRTTNQTWPDRLELRLSTSGNSTDVGANATSVGDFTILLLSVNPDLVQNAYPSEWTEYEVQISGLANTVTGRFALRYFVTNGGPSGSYGDYIGIDRVQYYSNPAQTPLNNFALLMGFGFMILFSVFFVRRVI